MAHSCIEPLRIPLAACFRTNQYFTLSQFYSFCNESVFGWLLHRAHLNPSRSLFSHQSVFRTEPLLLVFITSQDLAHSCIEPLRIPLAACFRTNQYFTLSQFYSFCNESVFGSLLHRAHLNPSRSLFSHQSVFRTEPLLLVFITIQDLAHSCIEPLRILLAACFRTNKYFTLSQYYSFCNESVFGSLLHRVSPQLWIG